MTVIEVERRNALVAQYEAPPAAGLHRYWLSVETWKEQWDETPFFFWQTASGCDYRLRDAARSNPKTAHLPERTGLFSFKELGLSDEELERLYVSNAMVCMLVDAPDEATAWRIVRTHFPDGIERFCSEDDDRTLQSQASGGRLERPMPVKDIHTPDLVS